MITVDTHLVQVDVLVRDKNGPVTGLTRDDFILLDRGKPQEIAVFSSAADARIAAPAGVSTTPAAPLPAGSFSNRVDRAGRPVAGATVILLDLLNTDFDHQAYAREGLLKYLRSLEGGEQVAIYMLGNALTVLQDFTDDPKKLIGAVRKFDPKDLAFLIQGIQSQDVMDPVDRAMYAMSSGFYSTRRQQITSRASAQIAEHMSGIPGRKSLVWVSDAPGGAGAEPLRAANINLYSVHARSVGESGVFGWLRDSQEKGLGATPQSPPLCLSPDASAGNASVGMASPNVKPVELSAILTAQLPSHAGMTPAKDKPGCVTPAPMGGGGGGVAVSTGVSFGDAMDLARAVQQAEEDAANNYTLGFYPSADALDGKLHAITVKLATLTESAPVNPALKVLNAIAGIETKPAIEVRYRSEYLAAAKHGPLLASAAVASAVPASVKSLFESPLNATAIGLTAAATPDGPAKYQVSITIDLHDLHLERQSTAFVGSAEISFHVEGSTTIRTERARIQLTEDQLPAALQAGMALKDSFMAEGQNPAVRIVVRDLATGALGSLRVPLNPEANSPQK